MHFLGIRSLGKIQMNSRRPNLIEKKENTQNRTGFWQSALSGAVAGWGVFLAFRYFKKILHQPRLGSTLVFSENHQFSDKASLAKFIASENLQIGVQPRLLTGKIEKEILHAGYRNFRESWARDFGFAAYGLVSLNKFDIFKDTMEAFFEHQTAQGQLPVKLYSIGVVTRFFYSLFGREQPIISP